MVLNVHRDHETYWGHGEGMEVEGEGDDKPIATLSPPEGSCIMMGRMR